MPHYHCRKCMHEFERIPYENEEIKCDWCNADEPTILEEKTPLERLCEGDTIERILDEINDEIN